MSKVIFKKFTSLKKNKLLLIGILFMFFGSLLFAVGAAQDTPSAKTEVGTKHVAKVESEVSEENSQPAAATTDSTATTSTPTKQAKKNTNKTTTSTTPQAPSPSQPSTPTQPPTNPPAPFTCNVDDNWIILAPGEESPVFTFSTSDGSNVSWSPHYKNVIWGDGTIYAPDASYWIVLDYNEGEHIASEVDFTVFVSPDALPSEHEEVAMIVTDDSRDIAMACTFKFMIVEE